MTGTPGRHPFADYVAPARARPQLWRAALGLGLVFALWVAWTGAVLGAVVAAEMAGGATSGAGLTRLGEVLGSRTPGGVLLMLATFIGIWPALWVVLRLLHRRGLGTLFAPEGRVRRREFGLGLAMAGAFFALSLVIAVPIGGLPERTGLGTGTWMLWLAPIAGLVVVQASAEEAIFRGYLLQQLAARIAHPVAWAVLPAALFGALHYTTTLPGASGVLYPVVTFLFGITAAVLVWRTGSLAGAMGLHTGINIGGLTLVGMDGVVAGSQLWLYPASAAEGLILGDVAASLALLAFVLSPLNPLRRPIPERPAGT